MSSNKDTFFTFLIGGLLGTIIGVLYSPKSGKENRKNIKKLVATFLGKTKNVESAIKEQESKIIHGNCQQSLDKNYDINNEMNKV
ncbi:MAG: YtxH domain-containing protein [Endomicrobium sp.]|jgi:gas vesicle protein|nr:YtxH domain-containing protein [Endomicrobium sp.]